MSTESLPLISGYSCLGLLGQGATSRVYLCQNQNDYSCVACKVIDKKSESDRAQHQAKAKDREVSILKKLKHPNIVQLFKVIDEKARTILFLEYVPESTELFNYIVGDGNLSKDSIMKIFGQLVMALKYGQDLNIVHRDLKPENILIDPNTQNIKLFDFGYGRDVPKENLVYTSCGSPNYAAPELYSGNSYDPKKSDVWSLGVVLYALATRNLPFNDENLPRLVAKVLAGAYQAPNADKDMSSLISSMININLSKRASLDEIIQNPLCRQYQHYFVDHSNPNRNLPSPTEQIINSETSVSPVNYIESDSKQSSNTNNGSSPSPTSDLESNNNKNTDLD